MIELRSRLLAALLVMTTAPLTAADKVAPRPNVLLLVSDDQRPDTIAALGNSIIETPNLDSLVQAGSTFTRAVCAAPICVSSRAEILSGRSMFTNGTGDFGGKLAPDLITWGEAMRDAGYRTGYVGKWHTGGRPYDHGYQECEGLFSSGGGSHRGQEAPDWKGRPATGYGGWVFQSADGKQKDFEKGVGLTADISRHFADAAIRFLEGDASQPFFLHVNFTAPHDPLIMPPGYAGKYDPAKMPLPKNFLPEHPFDHGNFRGRDELLFAWPRTSEETRGELACYYAVISHLDAQIGRILQALDKSGRADNTLVIFTADHGLAIGSHGLRGKQNMYEHTVNVPLVIRGPGVPAGKRFDAQVYLRELYPTTCELAGVKTPASVEAASFAPVLSGKAQSIHDQVLCYFRDVQRMIRGDRWKLIHYPQIDRYQLFDLKSDPLEQNDLSADPASASLLNEMKLQLAAAQRAAGDPLAPAE
jgi:arylsulfatase A-like enzyme